MTDRKTTPEADAGLVRLDDERAVMDVLARSVFGLWTVVNDLTRLRPVSARRIASRSSARPASSPATGCTRRSATSAAELTRLGCDIVTGGGPGLMRAANEGAQLADPEGKQRSVGIRVELPFEQEVNDFVDQAYEHGTFFTRLHHFALVSDAFVVVPGGIGTRARDDADLAAAPGAEALRHAADLRRGHVERARRVGAALTCCAPTRRSRAPRTWRFRTASRTARRS